MARVRTAQEETQGLSMWCEVADDSVIVMKSRPVKAGSRLEDNTGKACRGGLLASRNERAKNGQEPCTRPVRTVLCEG